MEAESVETSSRGQTNVPAPHNKGWQQIELTSHALVSDDLGRFLLTKRHPSGGLWHMPGGRVCDGETCVGSLVSRLHLELGLLTWPISVVHVTDTFHSITRRLSLTYSMSIVSGDKDLPRGWQFGEAQWFLEHQMPHEISNEALAAIKSRQLASFF